MAVIEIARIQIRRGQENLNRVPRLEPGEFAWAQDTENLYIGKRISEGAADDENTRILTEKDLSEENLFKALNISSATVLTPYQYRATSAHISATTVIRLLQDKLDESVSLTEFGVIPSFTATDISAQFQTAVDTIFKNSSWNSWERMDARRELKVPPGHYYISNAIELPPYSTLSGESPELTKITLVSSLTNVFRTMDADGNLFSSGLMESGVKRSRQVTIKNMTLEYEDTLASNNALVSFDNVLNAKLDNCILRTAFDSTTTTTYGLVSVGIGVEVRGTGGGIGSGDVNLCENVQIENCNFDGLYIGVRSTGTVIRPNINNCVLSNLNRGVEFYTVDGNLPGPTNGIISNNRFENIVREGIYVGQNPRNLRSNNISENNFFINVGNGTGLSDFITSQGSSTPVIRFDSVGNKTIDDFFHRRHLAETTTSSSFYYAPLVNGRAFIVNTDVTTATIVASSSTIFAKLPLNGQDQLIRMNYQLSNPNLSRKGELVINLSPTNIGAITDTFNYTETYDDEVGQPSIYFVTSSTFANTKNYVTLICVNESVQSLLEYNLNTMV
jgi:hypothetical protein